MVETASWLAATEAAFRAFDEEVGADAPDLDDRYAARFARDRDAFRRVFDSAVRCGDLKTIVLLGDILGRHDAHDWETRIAHAGALLQQESYEAAAAAFEPLRALRSARVVYGRARALAGAGRLDDALTAAEEAVQARPGHPLCEALRDRLRTMIPLHERRLALKTWGEIHGLFDDYMELGLKAEARTLLARVMADPAATELSIAQRLGAAELALRVCPPEEVRAYLRRLPSKYPDRAKAIEIAADVLSGGGRQHCAAAEPPADAEKALRVWTALACEAAGELPRAIRQLSPLAEEFKRDPDIRGALARTVGRAVLDQARPRFAAGGAGKIINLVMFNNEFALLRMHLEEMAPFVDRFVLVEAGQSFMGGDKPMHFQENRDQFADFADRIEYVALPRFPDYAATAWARDFHQRDVAIAAAQHLCGRGDYILATDTDEIIRPTALDGFNGDFAALQLTVSRFFLNYRMKPGNSRGSRPAAAIFRARYLESHGLSYARFFLARRSSSANVIPDAGWHFTSVNDADRIALKLGSYAHQEQTKSQFKTPAHFREKLDRIRAGEFEAGWERVELDDRLPPYIQRNRAALAAMIL
jgi:beta-1,4-mannosyl-glycoprotein beta-1,4-N-acetylglucosaminyltransferase